MEATMLAPVGPVAHLISTHTARGPSTVRLDGWPPSCAHQTADRIRAAIHNAGFSLPPGASKVAIDPALPGPCPGADLATALSLILSEPSRAHVRQSNMIAWGTLGLDGTVRPSPARPMSDLPNSGWVGRFWRPDDRIPDPDENAVLTVIDVPDIRTAWDVLLGLLVIESGLLQKVAR